MGHLVSVWRILIVFLTASTAHAGFQVPIGDLRYISYYASTGEGVKDRAITEFGKYAANAFQFEQYLNPHLNRTLSRDAERYAKQFDKDKFDGDSRLIPAYNAILDPVTALYEIFPEPHAGVTLLGYMLTLIPDPDRWFLIAALRSIEWKKVSENDFQKMIPPAWRALKNRVISYRKENTIYLNQGFFSESRETFRGDIQDGLENWLLWEVVKLWIPAEGDYDFASFGTRFSRMLLQANFNEFRVKDKDGHAALTFLDQVEVLSRDVRKLTNWSWHPELAPYFGKKSGARVHVRFLAPIQIESADGKTRDTYSFQHTKAAPGYLDGRNWIDAVDMTLFCSARGEAFPVDVKLTPFEGTLDLEGIRSRWNGVKPMTAQVLTGKLRSKETCVHDLEEFAKQTMFTAGEKIFL